MGDRGRKSSAGLHRCERGESARRAPAPCRENSRQPAHLDHVPHDQPVDDFFVSVPHHTVDPAALIAELEDETLAARMLLALQFPKRHKPFNPLSLFPLPDCHGGPTKSFPANGFRSRRDLQIPAGSSQSQVKTPNREIREITSNAEAQRFAAFSHSRTDC